MVKNSDKTSSTDSSWLSTSLLPLQFLTYLFSSSTYRSETEKPLTKANFATYAGTQTADTNSEAAKFEKEREKMTQPEKEFARGRDKRRFDSQIAKRAPRGSC